MKKIYWFIVLLFLNNNLFSQIESDENSGALEVSTGTINRVWYNKCDGVLYISYRTSGYAGDRALYKSYIYIKIGTQWKTMMTIRGEEVSNVLDNKGTCMSGSYNWNGTFTIPYQGVVTGSNHTNIGRWNSVWSTGNESGTIEAGHNKKRIAYYSGAYSKSYWASYEDEQLCKSYNATDLSVVGTAIQFQPYNDFDKFAATHSTGIQNNLKGIDICPTTDTEWGLLIGIANVPREAIAGNSIAVRIYKHYTSIYDFDPTPGTTSDYEYQEYSVSTNLPDGPQGLSASTDKCGQITLNWQNPAQTWTSSLNCTETQNYDIGIYRNGNLIKIVDGTTSTYDDVDNGGTNDLVPRSTYDYTVKTILWNKGDQSYRISASSNLATGSMKLPPEQPSPFNASLDQCDTLVSLSWSQPSGTSVDSFKIIRTGGTAFSATVSGSIRLYDDISVTRGTNYLYNIVAYNSCGYPSDTAQVNGKSPSDPAIATTVTAIPNASYDTITVSWTDNTNNETKYQIVRQDNLGNVVTFDVNPNITTYKDNGITACRDYSYSIKVFNDCVQSGLISSSVSTGAIPPPNLNTTFTSAKKLTCSKGYFTNRVELSWQNNNGQNIDLFKIYRKIDGTSFDSSLVGTAAGGSGFYVDNTADARVYYKYTIVGIKYCNGTDIPSNTSEDIGFRNPTGIVSGHIEYNGGIALNGAKVRIEPSTGATGSSLQFTSAATLTMENSDSLGLTNEMRVEFWFKPTSATNQNILNKAGVFSFNHSGSNYVATVTTGGTSGSITVADSNFALNNWSHVSIHYNGGSSTFKLYANGVVVGSSTASGNIASVSNQVIFGGVNSTFLLDEFRLIAKATLDTNIYIDYARFLNANIQGSKINLRFDEGFGNYAYDGSSQSNVFNARHFVKTSGATWSTDIPAASQLGYYGLTDSLGNYNVSGVAFSGTGENFTTIPSYLTHSFTPNSRSVFIGDASSVFNNQDFIDNSSFPVTGTLFYKNTTCPVPNATLKIDGLTVISNGQPVLTGANGAFQIQVPIGNHFIAVERFEHYMESGRFPASGTYDFQTPVSNIAFIDSTKRSIVGRVVGGLAEAEKAPDMGRSKNNLGKAKVRIVSPIAGAPCYAAELITDSLTGEFRFEVPPLEYKIDSLYIINNKNVLTSKLSPSPFTNSNQVIDLRNTVSTTTVVDSIFNQSGTWTGVVDSTTYHTRMDFIYRIAPNVNVTDTNGAVFIGEDSLKLGTDSFSILPQSGLPWGPFKWPVFIQGKNYKAKIHGSEIYNNFDNGKKDTVLLKGNVLVTNDLVSGADPSPVVSMTNGVAIYSFTCGEPNNSTHGINSDLDYSWDMQVVLEPQGAAQVTWKPNDTISPGYPNYRGLVIGQKITGTGVSTQGPEALDFILRDPPGSGSFASWTVGNSVTMSNNYSVGFSEEHQSNLNIHLGKKASVGAIAYYEEVEVENTQSIGFQSSYSKSTNSGYTETFSSSSSVSTRDDADNVGDKADIFVGRSRNWLVGPTNNIELRNVSQCVSGVTCFGPVFNGKRLAKTIGYAIAPDGVRTRFSYTADEITNVVIPQLESIRNAFFANQPARYISKIPDSDWRYGSNNDDPLWGADTSSSTPLIYDKRDTTGFSYTVKGILSYEYDSVRIINTQIRLWKEALAKNEKEKINCVNSVPGYTLQDNFTLGSAIVSNSYTIETEKSETTTFELALGGNVASLFGGIFGGIGVGGEISLSLNKTSGGEESKAVATSNAFEYTLTDGDPGDIMSVDVYKSDVGVGHIFVTRGGQTMCPYEDAVKLHYYNPSNPTAYIGSHSYSASGYGTIANATVKREEPNIVITPNNQFNIPSDQAAIYQLILTNQSALTVNNDIDLRVYVASQSNPYGAVVKIDGLSPNTSYNIPTGASVIKTLTVERGPIEINYDSLMIVFASECSNDIADTAYISAHFIPTCTELSMTSPSNNWVFNNSVNNTGNLIVSDYNYNYGYAIDTAPNPDVTLGFNKIGLEFKPTSTSTWTEFKSFYKYPGAGQDTIPNGQVYTQYLWNLSSIPDGEYEIKSKSYCRNKDGSFSTIESPVLAGIMDRINPHPFGTPSPADGILDPNDDIYIQFNEPVDIGALTSLNFDVRGVLNGGNIRHYESLNFDGVDDYVEVQGGAALQKRNFTVEFWAKRDTSLLTAQTILSQGTEVNNSLAIGFDAAGKLILTLGTASVTSNSAVTNPEQWHHYAIAYDFAGQVALLYVDGSLVNSGNTSILQNYVGTGKLFFGKNNATASQHFKGNLHELRLWNKTKTNGEIVTDMNVILSRTKSGLLYNWRMDEAAGSIVTDYIRSRDGVISGATWQIYPGGYAAQFDGNNDYVTVNSSTIPITQEMDFTLEFWFNSSQSDTATLFSNGKGDGTGSDSLYAWNIQKDGQGKIHVYHKGLNFTAVDSNYFDGNWHHFALVMQRSGNLSAYIDGNLQNSVQANSFKQMGGAKFYIGTHGYMTGIVENIEKPYSGKMDEFRFWNTARKSEQIKRDKNNRMLGDEPGLAAYVPFETYQVQLGVPVLTSSFSNGTSDTLSVAAQNGTALITQTPLIKIPRPVQAVNFTYSVNNDKIIITPTSSPEYTENVTLDITVKNILDMQGNIMQSPKTWIAYINKNQVKWQDELFSFEKPLDSVLTFTATIVNSGGAAKAYTITNLPSWLSANQTSGTISPNSILQVNFTIDAAVNIGDYTQDIFLSTDFNYPEKLTLNLKVRKTAPDWQVNPTAFQYSMNVFGQLKMDGIISSNLEDRLAAFVNGELRGVAQLAYVAAYDKYEVYMNIYSNNVSGDTLKFQMWNSTTGEIYVDVTPALVFAENMVIGSPAIPQIFEGTNLIIKDISLNTGWTWVSFPLSSVQYSSANNLLQDVSVQNGDVIKSISAFDQYDAGLGWIGTITGGSGYFPSSSYKIKITGADTIILKGSVLHPDSADIIVQPGWNWIGFVSPKNLTVNTALANYNASTGDIVKSQYEFSYYDTQLGWLGSLQYMRPGAGFMLYASAADTFNYPVSSLYGKMENPDNAITQTIFPFDAGMYEKNMSLIAKGNICHQALETGEVYLGAFDGSGNLMGYANPVYLESSEEYLFFITIYGISEGENINLSYFNNLNGQILETGKTISFSANQLLGVPQNPVLVNVNDDESCSEEILISGINSIAEAKSFHISPNPFAENLFVNLGDTSENAVLSLVSPLGNVIYSAPVRKRQSVKIYTQNLAQGIYFVRLTGDGISEQVKVIKAY